jgi:hypothetical protein
VNFIKEAKVLLEGEEAEIISLFLNPQRVFEFIEHIAKHPIYEFKNGEKINCKGLFDLFQEVALTNRTLIIKADT